MSSGPLFLEAFFTRAFTQHLLFSLVPALGPFLLAAAGATALTPLAMLLARRLGVVALPGGRHIHLRPTPLLGGWALYLAFAGAVAWYLGVSDWKIVGLLSLCGVATLLFTYDDRFRMAAPAKLAVEIGLGLVAVFVFGFNISFFTLPGGHVIQLGLVAYPLTVLWLLGMQNTIKPCSTGWTASPPVWWRSSPRCSRWPRSARATRRESSCSRPPSRVAASAF